MGISSTSITPDPSSILELRTTSKGLLTPRMTTTQRDAITSPATGLVIYNTTTNQFNFYNGTTWSALATGSSAVNSITGTTNRISIGGTSTDPVIDLSSNYVGQSSITTLGTIGTGTWNGTSIADGKIASALTGKTYNGLTLTAQTTGFTIAGGTTSKTLTVPLDASVSGTNTGDQTITLTGDVTGSGTGSFATTLPTVNSNVGTWNNVTVNAKGLVTAGSNITYVTSESDPVVKAISGIVKSNGTTISAATVRTDYAEPTTALATGLLKNTTTTGAHSIATAGTDYSAGTSALVTGILKSTTTTGALSIATASDFPTLNQNTTGNAATVTTNANLTGDVTSVGNATTLATVNSNVGTWNNVTVNAKGLVTAASNTTTELTGKLNSDVNSTYPDNSTYWSNATVANGFPVDGFLTGIRKGTSHTQRIQSASGERTLSRYWIDGSTVWSAWIEYIQKDDFAAKGDLLVGSGANTFTTLTAGANNTILTADNTTASGLKYTATTGTGNIVMTTSPTLVTPILGTPTSVTLTNATGLPISTGVSGLGTGVATFLATPSSANLSASVTDETGTGNLVFSTSPTFTTPVLGTPTSVTLTNGTGLPLSTGVTGILAAAQFPALTGDVTTTAGSLTTAIGAGKITNAMLANATEEASIVAATGAINTTETVVVKSAALAANRLVAGTVIRVTLMGTCTSSAANASTFAIRIGTNGTTADGLMQSAVLSPAAATSGTAIPFKAVFDITIRTIGTSATSYGYLSLQNHGITGIASQTNEIIVPTFTNFNTQTVNNIISITYKSAASTTTTTFQEAYIEFVYK